MEMLQIIFRTVIFINITFLFACDGFLINDNIQPVRTDGSVLTDKHNNFLMQFIIQERQSRLHLETIVTHLQQQLSATQNDLSGKIQDLEKCGCPGKDQVASRDNKTEIVEKKLEEISQKYETMEVQFNSLQKEHLVTINTSSQLEKDIISLKQLNVVSDAHQLLNLQNSANHLEKEIQKTNSKYAALESDANARKQDFLALFQKVQMSEKDLFMSNTSIQSALNTLTNNITSLNNAINLNHKNIQHIHGNISNRVVLSALAVGATVSKGHTVPFADIRTSHGINNLTSMRNHGKFTCEKTGYYLIAFFIATNAASGQMCIYVNNSHGGCASKHAGIGFQTHTAISLSHLNVNDTVDVRVFSSGSLFVWSGYDSIFSVLQVV